MGKLLGADVLIKCLLQENAQFIFGIPGAQPLGITDAIHRFGRREGLDFIMTRHEQAAAHMADTFSRLTGRPGVCLGTVGPGAVDLVPGVYEAFVNSIPMLVLTCQNQTWRSYPDHGSTQGCNQLDLFRPITKWSAVVSHWSRMAPLVQEAYRMALTGRPGPVHLDLPVDVLFDEGEEEEVRILPPARYRPTSPASADPELVRAGGGDAGPRPDAAHLRRRRRPAGGASQEVLRLAEFLGCPVTTSVTARGAVPEDDPHSLISIGLRRPGGPQSGGRGPGAGLPPGRLRHVGQAAGLGQARPAEDHPGGHGAGDPGREPGDRPGHPRRRVRHGARYPRRPGRHGRAPQREPGHGPVQGGPGRRGFRTSRTWPSPTAPPSIPCGW